MSSKLGQSLDEIMKSNGASNRRHNTRRGNKPTKPSGGISKKTKPVVKNAHTKATKVNVAKAVAKAPQSSTIKMERLPKDVDAELIKDFFNLRDQKAVYGPVKKVEVFYDANARSLGIAEVTFRRADAAQKAVTGLSFKIDNKDVVIKKVVTADEEVPQMSRITSKIQPKEQPKSQPKAQPKAQPKSAAADKKGAKTGKVAGKRGNGRAKNARPAKKTAEELDAEMEDYFDGAKAAGQAGNADANGGDAQMVDEIM